MTMDVDASLRKLGKWGKWQILFYLTLSVTVTFPASWHMLATVFIGGVPEHRCRIAEGADPAVLLPPGKDRDYSQCEMYKDISIDNTTVPCDNGWEYLGDIGPTIVTDWDLVCDKSALKDTAQTVMIFGVMVGAMGFSFLSDAFGRKPVLIFSELAMVVTGVITAFVDNYYLFCVLRFLAGAFQQGIVLTGFVMACELFPAEHRTFAGMAIENFWATGMCLLALFAYLIRYWSYLQLMISLPAIVTVSFIWILPESVPWLAANNKVKEAEEVLKKAAKLNGVEMPEHTLMSPEQVAMLDNDHNNVKASTMKEKILSKFKKDKSPPAVDDGIARYTLIDVFRHPKLRLYAIIMSLLWFVNSLVYYGLSLSVSDLAGDRYFNFFLSGLVEIPAYTSCLFILQRWGRRKPLALFHIVAGLALAITLLIPKKTANGTDLSPLIMTFNMIGKFGITGSFGTVFLYAPEIFPTTLRNQAMGVSSVGGRIGNMIAPFSSLLALTVPWLPGLIFGILSIVVGCLVFILPETQNRPLPQTIEDIENWSKTPVPPNNPGKDKQEMEDISNDVKV